MIKKTLNILQGPSGVGKSRLIERLLKDGRCVMEDKIRNYDLHEYMEKTLPPFESQLLIMAAMKDNLINSLFKEDKEIWIDTNLEGTLIISSLLNKYNLITSTHLAYIKENISRFYEFLFIIAKENNIELTINFLNLYKPQHVINAQIVSRGTDELDNELIMEFNDEFANITCEYNIIANIYNSKKYLPKYTNINYKTIKSRDENQDWNNIPLEELFNETK